MPKFAFSAFKTACYSATHSTNGHVIYREKASVGNNFHTTLLQIEHIDRPTVTATFKRLDDFEIALASYLNKGLTDDLLIALSPVEIAQVKRWKPETVGEVLFSKWD